MLTDYVGYWLKQPNQSIGKSDVVRGLNWETVAMRREIEISELLVHKRFLHHMRMPESPSIIITHISRAASKSSGWRRLVVFLGTASDQKENRMHFDAVLCRQVLSLNPHERSHIICALLIPRRFLPLAY